MRKALWLADLEVAITAEERYDSNPSSAPMTEHGDFALTLTPELKLISGTQRSSLEANYRLSSVIFHRDSTLNYTAHNAMLTVDLNPSTITRIGLKGEYGRSKDSFDLLDTGVGVRYSDTTIRNLTAGVTRQATSHLSLTLSAEDSEIEYAEETLSDTRSNTFNLAGKYALSGASAAGLNYTYSRYSFAGESGATDENQLQATWSKAVSEATSVNFALGLAYSDQEGQRFDWTGLASVEKQLKGGLLKVAYTREITHSSGLAPETSLSDRLTASYLKNISASWDADFSTSIGYYASEPSGDFDLFIYGVEAGTNWRPYKWLSIGTGVSHYQQWASGTAEDRARDEVFFNFTVSPVEWRI